MPRSDSPPVEIRVDAAIVAVTGGAPKVCTVGGDPPALPSGALDLARDRTLEIALRRRVTEQTGIELGYVEQLYTFGDRHRQPTERSGGARVVSVAYLALARESPPEEPISPATTAWRDLYSFLPWENRLAGGGERIAPNLQEWIEQPKEQRQRTRRRDRAEMSFGVGGAPWDGEGVLERYELLYEAGLVEEFHRDRQQDSEPIGATLGDAMSVDHRRICATALGRIRGKIRYRPLVFELLPERFTLFELQRVVEALAGVPIHKQNFRRVVDRGGLVEGTGKYRSRVRGRPAELFRFRKDVLRERQGPGVGLPVARFEP
ncbi:MAG: NAD regulator [Gemmatimonadetes bacterium]|nr:NAD regulator [Gemmatimonadota bacterium]